MSNNKKEFIVINESVWKSIVRDLISVACILTVVYFSYVFDSGLFAFFGLSVLLFCAINWLHKYAQKNTFQTLEEVIERLQKMKDEG